PSCAQSNSGCSCSVCIRHAVPTSLVRGLRLVLRGWHRLLLPGRLGLPERGASFDELGAQAARLVRQPLVFGDRAAPAVAGRGVRVVEDQLGLAPSLVPHLRGGLLGRDERRAEEALELAEA